MSTLRSIVDRSYEVFNARQFEAYRELLDEDVELTMSGVRVRGRAAVTDFVALTAGARPGLRIEPQRVFLETGETLVTEVRMTDSAPPGSSEDSDLEASACGLYRIVDGRIVEWRVYMDPVGEEMASAALVAVAAEQAALRRVAELVARQAQPEQVFALVAEELSQLFEVDLVRAVRFEPNGTGTVLSSWGTPEGRLSPGSNVPLAAGTVVEQVLRTGAPTRIADYADVPGVIGEILREEGAHGGVGGPIVVDGRLWGAVAIGSTAARALPPGTEERVAKFAELVSTAISNVESQAKVRRLAAEQSALRRVAELVAREYSPEDLFAALAEELGVLLGVDGAAIVRYEPDATVRLVAGWSDGSIDLPIGEATSLDGHSLVAEVYRSGVSQRKEYGGDDPEEIAALAHELGIRSGVGTPITVEGATWGMIAVLSRQPRPLPADTESRVAEFSRHAAMAVANAKSRSDLARSRARIVQAGDEARRRFERDLHDGAQQRLVSLGLELRAAEETVPGELGDLSHALSRISTGLRDVVDDLRELSRGLHPAVLSEGGLHPALRALARRSAIPVDVRLDRAAERLEEPVEVAAYFVACEALANTAKHADASLVEVLGSVRDGFLELTVRDDGRGGADASRGSGLTGLVDRVEAIGGSIQIDSPPQAGTALNVRLPVGKYGRADTSRDG